MGINPGGDKGHVLQDTFLKLVLSKVVPMIFFCISGDAYDGDG